MDARRYNFRNVTFWGDPTSLKHFTGVRDGHKMLPLKLSLTHFEGGSHDIHLYGDILAYVWILGEVTKTSYNSAFPSWIQPGYKMKLSYQYIYYCANLLPCVIHVIFNPRDQQCVLFSLTLSYPNMKFFKNIIKGS